jgi:hypothetical protein
LGHVDKLRQFFCNIPFALTANIELFQDCSNLEGQKAFKTLKTIGMTQEYQLLKSFRFNVGYLPNQKRLLLYLFVVIGDTADGGL